jgi:hypothetical protein
VLTGFAEVVLVGGEEAAFTSGFEVTAEHPIRTIMKT